MLYALAEEIDGKRDTAQIAEALQRAHERGIDAGMVEMLLDEQLRPLGIVAACRTATRARCRRSTRCWR